MERPQSCRCSEDSLESPPSDLWSIRVSSRPPGQCRLKEDRKSTRLNSSHVEISYAVFCLKKKIEKFGDGVRRITGGYGADIVIDGNRCDVLKDAFGALVLIRTIITLGNSTTR